MNAYRIYFLTPQNRIFGFVELDVAGDADAERRAREMLRSDALELWQGDRKLCRLDPPEQAQHEKEAQQC